MSSVRNEKAVRVGLVTDEPIRLEGLNSIFEDDPSEDQVPLFPVAGSMEALLADTRLDYMLVDLNSSHGGMKILNVIRKARPTLRLIVIGPEGNDELIMNSIIGGARAYLDSSASPRMVRMAIRVVISGYIWAPRRVLSQLIDRLLAVTDVSRANSTPLLTSREMQVLDLILMARSNREIAKELGIEERTVKAHVSNLMRKTGVDNRIELSMRALNLALASQPGNGLGI
jgi:DNA-binding NarL/FixJ family response regulator